MIKPLLIAALVLGFIAPAHAATPTDADKALAARFEALGKKLDGGRGREVVNLTRDNTPEAMGWIGFTKENTGEMALKRIKGEMEATDEQLAAARGAYERVVKMLEKVDALPQFPPYEIVRRNKTITIDGSIDPKEWKDAKVVPLHWQFGQAEPVKSTVANCRMMWDDENLYAAFEVPDAEVIGNEALDNDKNTYLYDCVELFLMPDARFPAYWEINITPKKEVVDRLVMKKPHGWFGDADISENIKGMKVGTARPSPVVAKLTKGYERSLFGGRHEHLVSNKEFRPGYSVEVAIPWSQLPNMKHGPKSGDTIHGIMAWSDVNGKLDYANQKYYSQVPTIAGFQSVWEFQEMKLVGKKGWFQK